MLTTFLGPFFCFFFSRHRKSLLLISTPHPDDIITLFKSLAKGAYLDKAKSQLVQCQIKHILWSSLRPGSVAAEHATLSRWRSGVRIPSGPHLRLFIDIFPVSAPGYLALGGRRKLAGSLYAELAERHKIESVRKLAEEYGVSHETVRQALSAAQL